MGTKIRPLALHTIILPSLLPLTYPMNNTLPTSSITVTKLMHILSIFFIVLLSCDSGECAVIFLVSLVLSSGLLSISGERAVVSSRFTKSFVYITHAVGTRIYFPRLILKGGTTPETTKI